MFPSLLFFAATAAHTVEAEGATGITKISQDFGLNLPLVLAQILSFSIVAFVLWKFAFKPVMQTLDARQQKISSGLRYADDMQAKLAATQEETATILKRANVEASRIIDAAAKTAKELSDKQTAEATLRASDLLNKAQQAIELEHRKMLADARSEIARLVVITTERVLARKLSESDRSGYNDAAARELTSV